MRIERDIRQTQIWLTVWPLASAVLLGAWWGWWAGIGVLLAVSGLCYVIGRKAYPAQIETFYAALSDDVWIVTKDEEKGGPELDERLNVWYCPNEFVADLLERERGRMKINEWTGKELPAEMRIGVRTVLYREGENYFETWEEYCERARKVIEERTKSRREALRQKENLYLRHLL